MLTALLKPQAVPMATLHHRYGSLLELVRKLIGVVPNCDPYLEIWPPAFRSYNVMVPNFLNLPLVVWGMGGAPRDLLGLAMYVSSRTAACAYCSAHTCSFALRRGASADKVAGALEPDETRYTPAERAVLAVARGLSRVPSDLGEGERKELAQQLSPVDGEWIVLGVAMMGFLNKWMDAVGVELESATVNEVSGVIAGSGWSPGKHGGALAAGGAATNGAAARADGLWTKVSLLRYAPSAVALDKKWTAGVPDRWPAVGGWLRERTGHDFPVLSRLTRRRAIRALATMLRDNLDPAASSVGIPAKLAAGLVYAEAVGDERLAAELRQLGGDVARAHPLARAIAPSPAEVDEATLAACGDLSPAAIVELVTFVAVMQLVHRLMAFFG
jgi:hypothetical protein